MRITVENVQEYYVQYHSPSYIKKDSSSSHQTVGNKYTAHKWPKMSKKISIWPQLPNVLHCAYSSVVCSQNWEGGIENFEITVPDANSMYERSLTVQNTTARRGCSSLKISHDWLREWWQNILHTKGLNNFQVKYYSGRPNAQRKWGSIGLVGH